MAHCLPLLPRAGELALCDGAGAEELVGTTIAYVAGAEVETGALEEVYGQKIT